MHYSKTKLINNNKYMCHDRHIKIPYLCFNTINPYLKTYNPYCQILMDFFCTRSISIVTNFGGYMPGGHGIAI